MKIQPVRGTHDIYGHLLILYNEIERIINITAKQYNYDEIITPIFESSDLFKKPLGTESDVVLKEMYTFNDRNNSSLTLRPEYTTPIIRAAISNNLFDKIPLRLFGVGPMFRRERPQKGRFRQFYQMNFEILGTEEITADVELILLANQILEFVFPNKKFKVHINSLGDKDTLKLFKTKLSLFFNRYKNDLSEDSQSKIITNPIRILDSKSSKDKKISREAPNIRDFYSKNADKKFEEVQNLLGTLGVSFVLNEKLVRGLDYYCHTVFEFKTDELGSQDTLIGGGRYDGLIKKVGGPDLPGAGFAGGIDRMIMLMDQLPITLIKNQIIIMDESLKNYGMTLFKTLQENKISVFIDHKYNLKKSLSLANKRNTKYAIIIGQEEYNNNNYILKNLSNNSQEKLKLAKLINKLSKN